MCRQLIILAVISYLSVVNGDTNYRLNSTITPISYAIAITPYFDTGDSSAFTFDGEVDIKFTTETRISQIKIHSADLNYTAANITVTSGSSNIQLDVSNPLEFDTKYTFAYINLGSELTAGSEYNLKISYRGPIREDLKGFYRNYYIENGVKKWLGATQMEPVHARKVFPCFDEPDLKAVFTITLDRPQDFKPSVANTKMQTSNSLSNGYIREVFYPTPKMSTYLVAFLISEFEASASVTNGEKEFGIYTRPEASNQSAYAFEFGGNVVDALGSFYGIDYYSVDSNLKLDHVALPDFSAGAMENWGLIKYRESLLLYVPEDSTPYYKYRVAQIIAHETTHMWFGNLVTCHWWSNTWLNEGFANYFQDYITSLIEPDVGAADMLVIGSVYAALDADDDSDSVPITNNNVNSPAEISGHFGTITYQKAGSIIRMMHHFIGDEAFKQGLHLYLETNKFEASYPDKLYAALEEEVSKTNSLEAYPGYNLTSVMSSWITQAGYPILYVEVNHENSSVVLTQKRFYIDPSKSSNELYKIPITYTTTNAPDFNNTKPVLVMDGETQVLSINLTDDKNLILFNIQETGFYRVNYDISTWKLIAEHLKGTKREEIHHLNRAEIVNDLFAFVFADEVKFDLLHEVLEFLEEESNYAVWYATIRGLKTLRSMFLGSDTLDLIDDYSLKLLDSAISKIGYDVNSTDNFDTLRNRMQILEFACKLGHQGCIDNTLYLFKQLKENGTEVSPSLRPVVYCTGLRFGNADDYDFMWNRMATTNVANEARTIGEVLGCTTVTSKLKSFLVSMLVENSPIRTQDLTMPLSGVLSNYSNVNLVLNELEVNYTLWKTIYPTMDNVFSLIASALHTEEEYNKFESWLNACSDCDADSIASAKKSLESAKYSTSWANNHKADVLSSLKGSSGGLTSSLLLTFTVVFFANYFIL
ncbi:unnamed protein product [Leptidea sinapis]|uniref:Aminopeptidase n=1 Tax=Leptidea sinapis TaxID=189913 RepID=A0A5E4QVB4_9NEOP|nr:unnamed protein product [Leptidea sinapis]